MNEEDIQEYVERETGRTDFTKNETGNYFKDEYYQTEELYTKHLINMETNVVSNEIEKLHSIVDKKDDTEIKNLESLCKNYGKDKTNDLLKNAYYLYTYYYFLFENQNVGLSKEKVMFELFKHYDMKSQNTVGLKELDICDLELFPYRTESKPSGSLFKKNKSYKDLKSSQYVANLIIKRVLDETKDKPTFVFRSYEDWFEVIKQELGKKIFKEISNENTNNKDLIEGFKRDSNETEDMFIEKNNSKIIERYDELFAGCFYITSSKQFAGLSGNNISIAPKIGPKISNNDYKKIQNIFKLD